MPSLLLYMHTSMSDCLFDSLFLPLSHHLFLLFPSISLNVFLHHSCSVSCSFSVRKHNFSYSVSYFVRHSSYALSHRYVLKCLDYIIHFASFFTFYSHFNLFAGDDLCLKIFSTTIVLNYPSMKSPIA